MTRSLPPGVLDAAVHLARPDSRTGRAVYPGSFDPPTVAHLAVVETVRELDGVRGVDLTVSRRAIAKEHVTRPVLEHRLEVLVASVAHLDEVRVVVTDERLIVDIASGYRVVVMGADKWRQVNDPVFYDDEAHRDAALAALPDVVVAARGCDPVPDHLRLPLPVDVDLVSSTRARGGDVHLMAPAARAFDEVTGAWTDPDRYDVWLADRPDAPPVTTGADPDHGDHGLRR